LQIVGQFDIPILLKIAIRFDKFRIVGQNFGVVSSSAAVKVPADK
jgi:hypothetical protein